MITYEELFVSSHTHVCLDFNGLCEGIFKVALIFWKGRPNTVFPTIKRHEIHLFLSLFAHMYVLYPELGLHLANPDHTPSNHNPDHVQGPKWALVTVDWPTHWAPSTRVHHPCNTWYLILELTWARADYCMTHSCNYAQLEIRPIKIISSLANTPLLVLSSQHRLPPAITARHFGHPGPAHPPKVKYSV